MTNQMKNERPSLSIIIPTLNEAHSIQKSLEAVVRIHGHIEIIIVDGGSDDHTTEIARQSGALVITSERGRGLQMNSGARVARGDALLFLHADTIPPPDAAERIAEVFARDAAALGGNFAIRFDSDKRSARFMTWLYPRLGKAGLCYGDSGIFVRASAYTEIGGFKPIPLFEDLDFARRLKKCGGLIHLPGAVVTSSRRFEGRSFVRTFARWSILQGLYWLGISPRVLSRHYLPVRSARARD
jgi:rSAM/selenodomain-associated transferase 2